MLRLPSMPTCLLLSPHLDDAAFSAGGTARLLTDAGWQVNLLTLYAASVPNPTGFALECQTSKGLAADVDYMRLRRSEDTTAAAHLGCERVAFGPLREAPHRGYESAAMLFEPPLPSDPRDPIRAAVRDALASPVDLLMAPQCWGRHVDHVLMTEALLSVDRPPTAWWQDLPYVLRDDPRPPPESIAERLPAVEIAIDIAGAIEAKLNACAAYESQLGFQFGGVAGMRRRLGQVMAERFLADASAAEMLRALP